MSYHRCPYGLHQVSLLLCRYCLDETSKRICITDGATERVHLSLILCKQCIASNKEMQAAANNVWAGYWNKKADEAAALKAQHEKEKEEQDKKKRLETFGLGDLN